MTKQQIAIVKDLAKQSYALEDQGGIVHSTGHSALVSWRREAKEFGDSDLVETLDAIEEAGEWDDACLLYERKYSALKYDER